MRIIRFIHVYLVCFLLALGCAPPATTAKIEPAPSAPALAPDVKVTPAAAPPVVPNAPAPAPAPAPAVVTPPAPPVAGAPAADATGDFVLSNLKISPTTVKAGGDITVTVTVKNAGTQSQTNKIMLNLVMEGEDCPTFIPPVQEVTLAGGASKDVTFKQAMLNGAGAYTVTVGKLSGNIVVQ